MRYPLRALCGLCVLVSLVGGCGLPFQRDEAPAEPTWLKNPPTAPGMIYGVGQVNAPQARDRAIAAARVDLASQLEISIAAERTQDDRISEHSTDGAIFTGRIDQDSRNAVRTAVAIDALPGLATVEVNEGPARTAALVVLDRRKWAENLRLRLSEQDNELVKLRDSVPPAPEGDAFAAVGTSIRTYRAVRAKAEERAETVRRLRVASPGESAPAPAVDITALRADMAARIGTLRLAMIAKDKDKDAISIIPLAYDRCNATGLKLVKYDAPADLRLALSVAITTTAINGETRADGTLRGRLAQSQGDRRLAAFEAKSRASSVVPEQAQERVRTKLAEQLVQQIDEHLLEWLGGL
jgi:hypothetical protein